MVNTIYFEGFDLSVIVVDAADIPVAFIEAAISIFVTHAAGTIECKETAIKGEVGMPEANFIYIGELPGTFDPVVIRFEDIFTTTGEEEGYSNQ
jgi:hypothetical protein